MVEYVTEDRLLSIDIVLRPPPPPMQRQTTAALNARKRVPIAADGDASGGSSAIGASSNGSSGDTHAVGSDSSGNRSGAPAAPGAAAGSNGSEAIGGGPVGDSNSAAQGEINVLPSQVSPISQKTIPEQSSHSNLAGLRVCAALSWALCADLLCRPAGIECPPLAAALELAGVRYSALQASHSQAACSH